MNIEFDVLIDSFIQTRQKPFTMQEVLSLLKLKPNAETQDMARELLMMNQDVLKLGDDVFTTRRIAFSGKTFSVLPTRYEIGNGILIIGHRCVPFAHPDVFPHEYTFLYEKKTMRKTTHVMQTNDLLDYYSLFGEEFVAQYLVLDRANSDFDFAANNYELPGKMGATVLDCAELYEKTKFKPGDRFLLTLADWDSSIFAVRVLKDSRANLFETNSIEEERQKWYACFEQSLLRTLDTYGPVGSIDEQLSLAFVYGGEALFGDACGSVEEFMRKTDKIEFSEYGVETRLWKKNETMAAPNFFESLTEETSQNESGEGSLLNDLFGVFGMSVPNVLIDSFLYDSLYRQERNSENVLLRLFPDADKFAFKDKLFCLLHLEKRRAIIAVDYNRFADYELGQLRSKILEFYMKLLEFAYNLGQSGVESARLPQQPLVVLAQLFTHLGRMLESLMMDEAVSAKDVSSMYLSLEGMQLSFEDLQNELEQSVHALRKVKFSIVKKEGEENE